MLGFVDFNANQILTAAHVDGVVRQSTMYFATVAARNSALSGSLEEGMRCYVAENDTLYFYNGTRWVEEGSEWLSYSPAWANLTVGSSSTLAYRRYEYNAIHCVGQITLASGFSIGGAVSQTIPDSRTTGAFGAIGGALYSDAGVIYLGTTHAAPGGTAFTCLSATGQVNTTVPFTWATGDVLAWDITIGLAAP
jgi:hypothetical protein